MKYLIIILATLLLTTSSYGSTSSNIRESVETLKRATNHLKCTVKFIELGHTSQVELVRIQLNQRFIKTPTEREVEDAVEALVRECSERLNTGSDR